MCMCGEVPIREHLMCMCGEVPIREHLMTFIPKTQAHLK